MNDKPLNLDVHLKKEKLKDRIYLVGIELEGGWRELPEGTRLVHDGSVIIREDQQVPDNPLVAAVHIRDLEEIAVRLHDGRMTVHTAQRLARERGYTEGQLNTYLLNRHQQGVPAAAPRPGNLMTGEVPSPPMPRGQLPTWMKKYYPSKVNNTCGLHIHQSFKSTLHYQKLMTPSFPPTVLKYVERWAREESLPADHPLWERLAGKSDYCQHKFFADQQAQVKEKSHDRQRQGHRYTVISYPWSRLGTMECRLLPMMETADQGIRAVENVLNITNAFLLHTSAKEEGVKGAVQASGVEVDVLQEDETGRRRREHRDDAHPF